MAIREHIREFRNRPVRDYNPDVGITEPKAFAYRLGIDSEAVDASIATQEELAEANQSGGFVEDVLAFFRKPGKRKQEAPPKWTAHRRVFRDLFASFIGDPAVIEVESLVIGDWGGAAAGGSSEAVVKALTGVADRFPSLRALFIGEIVESECALARITQSDLSPLWSAFPKLEYLHVRGGRRLTFGRFHAPALTTLIVEAAALEGRVARQAAARVLPSLEYLELWLGAEYALGTVKYSDLQAIFDGDVLPSLRHLGLRNFGHTDHLAQSLAAGPTLAQLTSLDLSLGTLGDEGAEALLESGKLDHLRSLDVHHHYLSNRMMRRLSELPMDVDVEDQREAMMHDGVYRRDIAHSE